MKRGLSLFSTVVLAGSAVLVAGCGGGSSSDSDSGTLISGSLNQGAEAAGHGLALKHGAGEHIESVQICALGGCSTTDVEGQWGFVTAETFEGGDVEFTVRGHGIDTRSMVTLPGGAGEIVIAFEHLDGVVTAETITADGAAVEVHDHSTHEHEE